MPNPTVYNDRLPTDILEDIFILYKTNETLLFPLETLLLVCKSWNVAASSYGALWGGKLQIVVSHEPLMKIWRSRLPVRLARSGSLTPLDISIDVRVGSVRRLLANMPVSPACLAEEWNSPSLKCPCVGKRERFMAWALDTLAGENGETCKRWRSLNVCLGPWIYRIDPHQPEEDGILLRGLTYPTPALSEVRMNEHSFALTPHGSTYRILPHVPVLSKLILRNCGLPGPLSLQGVKRIHLASKDWSYIARVWKPPSHPRVVSLCDAISVESLSLLVTRKQEVQLGPTYPQLTHLDLSGTRLPRNISDCKMPHLRHLSIDIGYPSMCRDLVVSCPGLLSQLTSLLVGIESYLSGNVSFSLEELRGSLLELLRTTSGSLTSFRSIEIVTSLVLKWLWESKQPSHSGTPQQQLVFKQNVALSEWGSSRPRIGLRGDESPADLEKIAQEWPGVLTPDQDWDTIVAALEEYVMYINE